MPPICSLQDWEIPPLSLSQLGLGAGGGRAAQAVFCSLFGESQALWALLLGPCCLP